jgi:proteasome lid subunit RPN8/RPN11
MTRRMLLLSPTHSAAIIAAARASFPCECCGLLEGMVRDDGWRVVAVHECQNVADRPEQHFLIDPQFQIDLLRRLRGTERAVIGCFHSHPRGRAEPSNTDLLSAVEQDFLWLIAAGEGEAFELRAHVFGAGTFEAVPMIESA